MTCVAIDRSCLMAADSCVSFDDMRTTVAQKIIRLSSGALLGKAGDADVRNVVAILDKIRLPSKLPTRAMLAEMRCEFHGILVLPSAKVFLIQIGPVTDSYDVFDGSIWEANRGMAAIGTGAYYAIGAMDAGKNAVDAVKIACNWDKNSRLPVHSMALIEKPKKVVKK